ncbi:putative immunity protein [Corynebacterium matruchotii]|uniref:putative immunity protein n=1 Tax=Corynebacterium matruchotii TaxID=43768 RepID=UPI0028E92FEF|nr:hypothetical protein [Corynebacterium matruchotii]
MITLTHKLLGGGFKRYEGKNEMDIYAYQRPLGRITDDEKLRNRFIELYDAKTHQQIVQFCRDYARHLHNVAGFPYPYHEDIADADAGMRRWLAGEANYHEARNCSFRIGRLAKETTDSVTVRFLRTMAQITASPHVKYHGLWAADFAVTFINTQKPGDMAAVRAEREHQITLLSAL